MPYHKLKIRPDIQKRIVELRAMGIGYRKVADKVMEEFGISITHQGVKDFMTRAAVDTSFLIKQNQVLAERVEKDILDTLNTAKKIMEKSWMVANLLEEKLKETGDVRIAYALSNQLSKLTQQLKTCNELLGTFKPMPSSIQNMTVNVVDMSIKISSELKRLEKLGYIKILQPIS